MSAPHAPSSTVARLRRAAGNVLVAVLSVVVTVAALEGLAAALGAVPLRETQGYAARAEQARCRFVYDVERACRITPQGDATLIVTLGGSTTAGFGVGAERAFAGVLQRMLDESAGPGRLRVVNLGSHCKDSIYVQRCAEVALRARPRVLVVYAGHNDFANFGELQPRTAIFREHHPWTYRLEWDVLARSRFVTLVAGPLIGATRTREPNAGAVILAEYRRNLSTLIDQATAAGTTVVLVTVVSNVADFPRDAVPCAGGPWCRHMTRGRKLLAIDAFAEAHTEFEAARDLRWFGRAPSSLNALVRSLAAPAGGVHVVDFEAVLDERARREPIGCTWFTTERGCDQFHPSPETHRLIAVAVHAKLAELGLDS